jgi:hypothetical protein
VARRITASFAAAYGEIVETLKDRDSSLVVGKHGEKESIHLKKATAWPASNGMEL